MQRSKGNSSGGGKKNEMMSVDISNSGVDGAQSPPVVDNDDKIEKGLLQKRSSFEVMKNEVKNKTSIVTSKVHKAYLDSGMKPKVDMAIQTIKPKIDLAIQTAKPHIELVIKVVYVDSGIKPKVDPVYQKLIFLLNNRPTDEKDGKLRDLLFLFIGTVFGIFCLVFVNHLMTYIVTDPAIVAAANNAIIPKNPNVDNGWGAINVYYEDRGHLQDGIEDDKYILGRTQVYEGKQWYSQHGQDLAAAMAHDFKENGYFVDLAANDAVWASNTYMLEHYYGWKGICIEPNSFYWYRLAHRKCAKVAAVIGDKDEEVKVVLGNDKGSAPYGGIIGSEFDNHDNPRSQKKAESRFTVPLEEVLRMHDAPKVIDYMSFDVEGAETFILKNFDFDQYTFKVMTVERPKDELLKILKINGYKHIMDFHRGDTLWAHESYYERAKHLVESRESEIKAKKISPR